MNFKISDCDAYLCEKLTLMKSIFPLILALLSYAGAFSQLVINEIDADNPSTDTQEFVELKSENPYEQIQNKVLVFFNGGNDESYLAVDLDGYETDINGLLVIGNAAISPVPQIIIANNKIQNGPDAVAIYNGSATDFPKGTMASSDQLIDALVYGTNDSNATNLMQLLGEQTQYNEGAGGNTNSLQLQQDGSYITGAPNPRQLNDGSGVLLNALTISINEDFVNEGDDLVISFELDQPAEAQLQFQVSYNNGAFDLSDYAAAETIIIAQNQTLAQTVVTITDDELDEGDEEMYIQVSGLPNEYVSNNSLLIRVLDNDYIVEDWGVPTSPTFNHVVPLIPEGYYNDISGKSGNNLKQAIQDIVANPDVVRAQTYKDVFDILKEADKSPENSNRVWLVYSEESRSILDQQNSSQSAGKWNREHTFPRSRGGFSDIMGDSFADGKEVFWETSADSLRHANSDAHAIRAADSSENISRGNQFYGEYTGPSSNLGSFKGDVARGVLFLDVRYNDLEVVNGYPDGEEGKFGDLQTLLDWHRNDPPDDFEKHRNNVVYEWQFNRNPFIDMPDLVEYLWGNKQGDVWENSLDTDKVKIRKASVTPNPSNGKLFLSGSNKMDMSVYGLDGKLYQTNTILPGWFKLDIQSGIYILKLTSNEVTYASRIIIN